MFDIEVDLPTPKKIPTFLQYLKTTKLSKSAENQTFFSINLIWLPGTFDNVTLQTHAFRYIILPETPLYQPMIDYCANLKSERIPQIGIYITSLENKTIRLGQHPKKRVDWESVGNNGIRFIG